MSRSNLRVEPTSLSVPLRQLGNSRSHPIEVTCVPMKSLFLGFLLVGLAEVPLAIQSSAQYPRAPFVTRDEATNDPSLKSFRDHLLQVAERRDWDALNLTFEQSVVAELAGLFAKNTDPTEAALWNELARILRLGGSFTTDRGAQVGRTEFCAPYAYSAYPAVHQIPDALLNLTEGEVWVVVAKNVAVRSRPSSNAPVIARLSEELVAVQDQDRRDLSGGPTVFQLVELPSGKIGYADTQALWGIDRDYHVCFTQLNGGWRVTTFARGLR